MEYRLEFLRELTWRLLVQVGQESQRFFFADEILSRLPREIRIGQQCLSDISTKEMRRLISFIPQDNTLFHGTIRENLLYGKNESVSEERIAYILKELGLSPLVAELEDGLDTRISENGTGLSEGQNNDSALREPYC